MPHSANEPAGDINGNKGERRPQVLVWIAPELLQSPGMLRILHEAELLPVPEDKWEEFIRASMESGGFALGGRLAEIHHGAGIWISPEHEQALEVMIPWMFVRSVVTAPDAEPRRVFGLSRNGKSMQPKTGIPE